MKRNYRKPTYTKQGEFIYAEFEDGSIYRVLVRLRRTRDGKVIPREQFYLVYPAARACPDA